VLRLERRGAQALWRTLLVLHQREDRPDYKGRMQRERRLVLWFEGRSRQKLSGRTAPAAADFRATGTNDATSATAASNDEHGAAPAAPADNPDSHDSDSDADKDMAA
jgi:hypothetical protein